HYHRAGSLEEAVRLLAELGEEARLLAGGQSLIPLMKLRLASPQHLVDLNFVPDLSYMREDEEAVRFGALTRHVEIESSAATQQIPLLHDCAAGIADVQVRTRGTIGGSLAEADPSGDWAPVLLTLSTEVVSVSPAGERVIPLTQFITDAYTTVLAPAEVVREVVIQRPLPRSGGAYLGVKRSAPVYATASAAVQLTLEDGDLCREAGVALGAVGLTAIKATDAEAELRGQRLTAKTLEAAAEAAAAMADPQSDQRGSAAYKRNLVRVLVKRAAEIALRRARGETVEVSHIYG
ncbi:MAG: FAD binding domain-containing protein, partial [Candidatus Acidiferrales bacterium]